MFAFYAFAFDDWNDAFDACEFAFLRRPPLLPIAPARPVSVVESCWQQRYHHWLCCWQHDFRCYCCFELLLPLRRLCHLFAAQVVYMVCRNNVACVGPANDWSKYVIMVIRMKSTYSIFNYHILCQMWKLLWKLSFRIINFKNILSDSIHTSSFNVVSDVFVVVAFPFIANPEKQRSMALVHALLLSFASGSCPQTRISSMHRSRKSLMFLRNSCKVQQRAFRSRKSAYLRKLNKKLNQIFVSLHYIAYKLSQLEFLMRIFFYNLLINL